MTDRLLAGALLAALPSGLSTTIRRFTLGSPRTPGAPLPRVRERLRLIVQDELAVLPTLGILVKQPRTAIASRVATILEDVAFAGRAFDILGVLAHLDGTAPLATALNADQVLALRDGILPHTADEAATLLAWRLAEPYLPFGVNAWRREMPTAGGAIEGPVIACIGRPTIRAWILDSPDGLVVVEAAALSDVELTYRLPWGPGAPARPEAAIALRIEGSRAVVIVDPNAVEEALGWPGTRAVTPPDVLLPTVLDDEGVVFALSALGRSGLVPLPANFLNWTTPVAAESTGWSPLPPEDAMSLQAIALGELLGDTSTDPMLSWRLTPPTTSGFQIGAIEATLEENGIVLSPASETMPLTRLRVGGIETHRRAEALEGIWSVAWRREDDALLLIRRQEGVFALLAIPRDEAQGLVAAALLASDQVQEGDDALDLLAGTKISISDIAWRGLSFTIVNDPPSGEWSTLPPTPVPATTKG